MSEVIKNAVIESVSLRIERGFILDSWLQLDYGGTCQGFGGYALYLGRSAKHHSVASCAGHWIARVMEVAGVEDWNKMAGRTVRARLDKDGLGGRVIAIGHIVKDDWFCPGEEFNVEDAPTRSAGGAE